jgi:hypothetical protein
MIVSSFNEVANYVHYFVDVTIKEEKPTLASVLATKDGNEGGGGNHHNEEEEEERGEDGDQV